jgi:hypothetical protein
MWTPSNQIIWGDTIYSPEGQQIIWPHPYEWLLFAALAMLTGSFSLKIASISASVTVCDTFFVTTALLFGPAPASKCKVQRYQSCASSPRAEKFPAMIRA